MKFRVSGKPIAAALPELFELGPKRGRAFFATPPQSYAHRTRSISFFS